MRRFPDLKPMRAALLLLVVVALGPLVISNTSCTAIGYSIGNALTKNDTPRRVPAGRAVRMEIGTPMEVALEDATVVRGVYVGRARLDDGEYAARYEAWRARTPGAFALGGEVELVDRHGRARMAMFLGFCYRAVSVSGLSSARLEDVPFAKLHAVRAPGAREWTAMELAELDARGDLPSREALAIGQGLPFDWQKQWSPARGISEASLPAFSDTTLVPMDGVQTLSVPSARGLRTVCTLAGFAVDATVIAFAAAMASWDGPFGGGGGCDANSMNFAARHAPSPTNRDFDRVTGEFVPPAVAASQSPAADYEASAPVPEAPSTTAPATPAAAASPRTEPVSTASEQALAPR